MPDNQKTDESVAEALRLLAGLIADAANRKPEVRKVVHGVCAWLAARTSESASDGPVASVAPHAPALPVRVISVPARPPTPVIEKELFVGDQRTVVRVASLGNGDGPALPVVRGPVVISPAPPSWESFGGASRRAELPVVSTRCRLKAAACRWGIERRRRAGAGEPLPALIATDQEFIRKAKAMDGCWLWVFDPSITLPPDEVLALAADNYELLAVAADIASRWLQPARGETIDSSLLYLLAEAQSSLRAALLDANIENDTDQLDLFWYLRDQTQLHRVYVDRFMKRDDPADPTNWAELRSRIEDWAADRDRERSSERGKKELLHKVQYHIKRIAHALPEDAQTHWTTIVSTLSEWVRAGYYPSDSELCQMLLPVYDSMPETLEVDEDAGLVIRYVDALAAQREAAEANALNGDAAPPRRSAEVVKAANVLRGKVAVLIGGEVRLESKRRLERDLELKELRWLSTLPHERLDRFVPDVTRDDVDLALVAIRLTSHSHGELSDVCVKHGKPFVRLPGGYGSSQVAHQVLKQASGKLAETVGAEK